MNHLFKFWDRIEERIKKAEQIFLLLDYDGTLTPIVETPDKAVISTQTKRLLESLKKFKRLN
jgi:trehalose-6-phosphatase